jgi:uncharacterized repeat protein (TIGR01451 family)
MHDKAVTTLAGAGVGIIFLLLSLLTILLFCLIPENIRADDPLVSVPTTVAVPSVEAGVPSVSEDPIFEPTAVEYLIGTYAGGFPQNNLVRKVTPEGTISTIAGNGAHLYAGDNGEATMAQLVGPWGATVDNHGNLYIADNQNNRIRKISPGGTIGTAFGNGSSNVLDRPTGLTSDSAGNLYFSDTGNFRVRELSTAGTVTTIAGNGTQGYSGDNGPATSARLNGACAVAVDPAGNVYIGDSDNFRVRKVSGGTITTVVGTGVKGDLGDGGPGVSAQISSVSGLALDSAGNLYIADPVNSTVRKLSPAGIITTVAGQSNRHGYSGDGGPATSARLAAPEALAVDPEGNLYIADGDNRNIRKVSPDGMIGTIAGTGRMGYSGDGGLATKAELGSLRGVALDAAGNIYVADHSNNVVRVLQAAGTLPLLTVTATHSGNFTTGQIGATYSVTGSNAALAGASNGPVTVEETVPTGLTLVSMAGAGWMCGGNTCTRSDPLARGASYPAIVVTVNVAGNAAVQVSNIVSVSGGGSISATTMDTTNIGGPQDLTVAKTHVGSFVQGQTGATYTITVGNSGSGPTVGTVAVSDYLPIGLTAAALSGQGWDCTLETLICTRSDALAAGATYPAITVTVDVMDNAPSRMTNTATVSGGGEANTANDVAADVTTIRRLPALTAGSATAARARIVSSTRTGCTNGPNLSDGSGGFLVTGTCDFYKEPSAYPLDLTAFLTFHGAGLAENYFSPGYIVFTTDTEEVAFQVGFNQAAWKEVLFFEDNVPEVPASTKIDLEWGDSLPSLNTVNFFLDPTGSAGSASFVLAPSDTTVFSTGSITFTVHDIVPPILSIAKSHTGNFTLGQSGAAYTMTVSNLAAAAPTSGTVTVTEAVPTGLTLVSMTGTGWTCPSSGTTCTRSDVLAAGASYPAIAVAVNVAANAPGSVTNQAGVSGGGSGTAVAGDATTIVAPPVLSIAKSHAGSFIQGQASATFSVAVSNATGAGATSGTVTVTEAVPTGLTLVAMTGTGWSCPSSGNTCTRSDVLAAGASYPAITVTVNVAANASSSVTNQASVSGGGAATTNASDTALVCGLSGGGIVTVSEVQTVVNEALGRIQAVHDLNHDGVVSVVDVQIEINAALGLSCLN